MALSQRHRQSIYVKLAPTIGEEEADALLSQFPSIESEEPVTVHRLDASIAGVRADFADLRADFADLKADFAEVKADFAEVRTEIAEVRTDVAHMEASLVERMRQQAIWTLGAMVSGLGVGMGIAAAISQAIG